MRMDLDMRCPFCQDTTLVLVRRACGAYVIECGGCQAQGPAAATGMDAEIAWGQRFTVPLRRCRECERVFRPSRPNQRYCTRRCTNQASQRTWHSKHGRLMHHG